MRTISNSEFAAHAEMYLDMARDQDVCIRKGQELFYIVHAPGDSPQTALSPDEDLRRALPADEFRQRLAVVLDRVDKKYAAK